MSEKILLISLRDPFLDSDRVMPPLGIMSLNQYLLESGHHSVIENNFDFVHIEKYSEYTFFGISCMTPQIESAYQVANAIKSSLNNKIIIIGGPHVLYYLNDQLLQGPFDYFVQGDGEKSLKTIIEERPTQKVWKQYLSSDELDSLPPPYREPSFLNQYSFDIQGIRSSTILTARGCPMGCRFCEDARTALRYYNPTHIRKQISDIKEANFQGIMFFDDIFAININRIKNIAPHIIDHEMYYRCFGHAKIMTENMAKLLAETGCIETGFGAESGAQLILNNVGKGVKVEENFKYIDVCNKHQIKVKAFLLIGLPGESYETIEETKKFLNHLLGHTFKSRLGKTITNDFDICVYYPYKGTQFRNMIDSNMDIDLFFTPSSSLSTGYYKGKNCSSDVVVRTKELSAENLKSIQQNLFSEYKSKVVT